LEAITPAMLISGLCIVLMACIGWWVSNLYAEVRAQAAQITDLKVRLAQDYMTRPDVEKVLERIFDKLEEIQRSMHP
jgi:hypothetical protein